MGVSSLLIKCNKIVAKSKLEQIFSSSPFFLTVIDPIYRHDMRYPKHQRCLETVKSNYHDPPIKMSNGFNWF